MNITQHLDNMPGEGKRFVLLMVTPKGQYPRNFLEEDYYNFEYHILANPRSYIGIYQEDRPEIMQGIAFRIFVRPLICDYYHLPTKRTTHKRRLNERGIESYFAMKEFFETVPYGEKKEKEAIADGIQNAKAFLRKYPLEDYECVCVELSRHDDAADLLMKIDFNKDNENYHLDYVYVR